MPDCRSIHTIGRPTALVFVSRSQRRTESRPVRRPILDLRLFTVDPELRRVSRVRRGLSLARVCGLRVAVVLAALFAGALVSAGQAAAAPVQWCGNDVPAGDRYPDAIG